MSQQGDLVSAASQVRSRAYAPYSGYRVGAAVRAASGAIFAGCNVENLSYGATICAERSAIVAMVAAGETKISEVAVATKDGGTPCGMCLQVIAEFVDDASACVITCVNESGDVRTFALGELLPYGFQSSQVGRTESGQ